MSVAEPEVSPRESAAERSRRETRRRLLEAGTELFAREGLHGATSAQIARRAGVAAGTFYLHFKDKRSLFREIVFDALARLRVRQDVASAGLPRGSRAEIAARMGVLLDVAAEQRSLIRVLFGRGHEAADLGEEVLAGLLPGLEERLRARAAGLHPAAAAQALVGMVTRVIAWWAEDPSRAPRESVVETLTRLHPVGGGAGAARSEED
jgi:AcrR family transcriptional regulator